jgi:PhnB protein
MNIDNELCLCLPDTLAAFETYRNVFGAKVIEKTTLDRGLNEVVFTISGIRFHILDENHEYGLFAPQEGQKGFFWLNLMVENIKEVFDKAEAAGFTPIMPIQEMAEHGLKTSMQKDPWGYVWQLHQKL